MEELDFTLEFNSAGVNEDLETILFDHADDRLRTLKGDHRDMVGAAVNIREPAHGETAYLYEATVVIYIRPENIAATEKADNPTTALKGALTAVERQVREGRKKRKEKWKTAGATTNELQPEPAADPVRGDK
jgi:ribosome-associated translation inhibitor RaiA